jgi:peptide/nickel transport system permease protein
VSFRRFFLVRLAWALIGLWAAGTAVFLLSFVLLSHPERSFCGGDQAVPACVERARMEFHLDAPLYEQYAFFVWRLAAEQSAGPTSYSRYEGGPPLDSAELARDAVPATASVVVAGLALALGVAGLAGTALARLRWRRIFNLPIYVAFGLSPIFLGLLLSYHVGVKGFLPIANYCDVFNPPKDACGGVVDWSTHLVLPAVTLSLYFAAIYTRVVRAIVVRIVSAKELQERREQRRRYVLLLARAVSRDFGFAIGVAMLVEVIFEIPGLGRGVVTSIYSQSFVELQAYVLYGTFLAIAVHFLVDVIVGALDPRLRSEWPVARMPKPT